MNINDILKKIEKLPKGEEVCTKGSDGWITVPELTTDDLIALADHVRKLEAGRRILVDPEFRETAEERKLREKP